MIDKLIIIAYRVMFVLAIIVTGMAVWDKIIMQFGYRLSWVPYGPAKMLEISSILVLFIIALLLRQIRDILQK